MKRFMVFVFVFTIIFNCSCFKTFAENSNEASVYLRVEGTENTVMEGEVKAETAIQALQQLGEEKKVKVILKINDRGQEIYSIDNITNDKFGKNDCWNICIFRENEVIASENLGNIKLLNGDKIVVYYGYKNITPVEIEVAENYEAGMLKLKVSHKISKWVSEDGKWLLETVQKPLEGVTVHLNSETVAGSVYESVYSTDEQGLVQFEVKNLNIYTYFLEGYKKNSVPDMVKTLKTDFAAGIDKGNKLTRAEAAALLINYYGIEKYSADKKTDIHKSFTDIETGCEYKEYLELALSKGIIKGNGDGTFRPNDEITLQELASILDNIFTQKKKEDIEAAQSTLMNCDDWAVNCIKSAVQKGIIPNGEYDWTESVDLEDLTKILFK